MRKMIGASAVCALAICLVAAPGAVAKKGPKQVSGTVSVFVSPNPVPSTATGVTASGNVKTNSSCRKDRTVRFQYVNSVTGAIEPLAVTAETRSNGDYSVVLPRATATTLPQTYALQATVDETVRKVGSKKKGKRQKRGRQFNCLELFGQSTLVTFSAPPAGP